MQRGPDRVIAGVCSGLARSQRIDPLIVRVAFVVLAVAGGVGIPLYFGLWCLMPGPDGQRSMRVSSEDIDLHRADLRQPLAIGLIVGGVVLLLGNVGPFFNHRFVWALVRGGVGLPALW